MPDYEVPNLRHRRQLGDIGMYLFLFALATLFVAGLLGYVLIHTRVFGEGNIGPINIRLPWGFWLSTAIIIAASVTFHCAVDAVAHERQAAFRSWLMATMALGILFVIIQIPCLSILLQENMRNMHASIAAGRRRNALYGFVFVLIALHALHVVGGIIALIRVSVHAVRGRYDHEHYGAVKHTAQYWHFIDIVWLVLFGVIWLLG